MIRRFRDRSLRAVSVLVPMLLFVACGRDATGAVTRPGRVPSSLPPATAPPSGSPASPAVASVARTITEADNGATVQVAVGEEVALALRVPPGSDPWQVEPPDPRVLTPIPNPATAAVGVTLRAYRATGRGQAAISATSRPHCDPGAACPGLIRGFRVTVTVATS